VKRPAHVARRDIQLFGGGTDDGVYEKTRLFGVDGGRRGWLDLRSLRSDEPQALERLASRRRELRGKRSIFRKDVTRERENVGRVRRRPASLVAPDRPSRDASKELAELRLIEPELVLRRNEKRTYVTCASSHAT